MYIRSVSQANSIKIELFHVSCSFSSFLVESNSEVHFMSNVKTDFL